MILLDQPGIQTGGQAHPHSSFYTRLEEHPAPTGALAQLAMLGGRGQPRRSEADSQKEDGRWDLLGAGEKPVAVSQPPASSVAPNRTVAQEACLPWQRTVTHMQKKKH